MTISGGRTEQLDIIAGFTSDFLSFIVLEGIQFFSADTVWENDLMIDL